MPVDLVPLIGHANPMMANLSFTENLSVAVLGSGANIVKIDLAERLWPGAGLMKDSTLRSSAAVAHWG